MAFTSIGTCTPCTQATTLVVAVGATKSSHYHYTHATASVGRRCLRRRRAVAPHCRRLVVNARKAWSISPKQTLSHTGGMPSQHCWPTCSCKVKAANGRLHGSGALAAKEAVTSVLVWRVAAEGSDFSKFCTSLIKF